MENVKGMFTRKYGGVPAWLILLVAVGGVYLYMRHTGSSLFGGSGTAADTSNTDTGSASTMDGQAPEIVFIPSPNDPAGTGTTTSNPNHPHHPAGPPPTHKVTDAQRAAAIMADIRKHGLQYLVNHPNALPWLKTHAPGDYRVVTTFQRTGKWPTRKQPPKQGGNPPRRNAARKKVSTRG